MGETHSLLSLLAGESSSIISVKECFQHKMLGTETLLKLGVLNPALYFQSDGSNSFNRSMLAGIKLIKYPQSRIDDC